MARTPWGEIPVADAHVHFFSPAFFQSADEQYAEMGGSDAAAILGWEKPATCADLTERWIGEMDRHGVDKAMLIASIPNDTDSVGEAIALYPRRFSAVYMAIPGHHGSDLRLQSAIEQDNVSGVFLFPAMHRYSLHDDRVFTLLQMLGGQKNAVVYIHCGVLTQGFRTKLGLQSPFNMEFSNPVDVHELAAALPRVKFVIPHFGAGFLREALMVADLCPNVYLDTSSSNRWMRYVGEDLKGVYRRALDVLGPGRLLFGTDSSYFPRGWVSGVLEEQLQAMQAAGVREEGARAILGGNLRSLLG